MTLFQNSVLRNFLQNIDKTDALQAYTSYKKDFLPKIANIKTSKEEQYQYGFLDDLFVKVLGYTLNPTPAYNLIAEQKNLSDAKKADGAVLKEGKVIAVIELKSTKTKSMDKIVNQAFNYKHNHPSCKYVITSNFEKLRFYVEHSDKYEEFNLFDLDEERFILLYTLLNKESIFDDVPLTLKKQSKLQEENISNELYKKYATLRTNLFENIIQNNPSIDKHILLEKTQTILDRMVFIFFAEDRGILPPNTIQSIVDHYEGDIEDRELWHFYKIYFNAINKGNAKLNIPEYNGGLFATNALLDNLIIDNDVINACPLALSAYDFNSDIDVNILGHIFENSLNDIEELKARINDDDFDANKSKRKKDGVFYTPEYITKYIVDNTLGSLCQAKKEELGLDEVEIEVPKNPKKLNKTQSKQKEALEAYREYLLGLKILDPACGSGAFLNQALNYLLEEHAFIDESIKTLMGGSVLGLYDVKKGILENNLYGVDINAEAVEIAKLSLWLRTVESGRKLNKLADKIKVGNSLIDDKEVADDAFVWEEEFSEVFAQGGFDVVIGNPPYITFALGKKQEFDNKDIEYYKTKYPLSSVYKVSSYLIFIEKSLKLLSQKGLLSFIVPNTIYTNYYYANFREFLINDYGIESLFNLTYEVFNDADTGGSAIFVLGNNKQNDTKLLSTYSEELFDVPNIFSTNQNEFKKLPDNKFLFSNSLISLWNKAFQNSIPLGSDNFKFYNGIKTGNNKKFLSEIKIDERYKPVIRGRDFYKYVPPKNELFVLFDPKQLWSNTNEEMYLTKEKLIFRQTSDHLVVTYDDKQNFTMDTTHILFDKSNKYSHKYLLAIVNSKLLNFLYQIIVPEIGKAFSEVKGVNLKKLPIKLISCDSQKPFTEKADTMLTLTKILQTKKQKFLKRVTDNLEIDKLSKKLEAFYIYDFKTFLAELKKKKVTLSLVQQDEWEEYFSLYKKELTELQTEIDNTDKEIDKMVYALYGLSEDEIAVVEG